MSSFPYVEFDGHRRYLACLPSPEVRLKSFPNWSAAGNPVLPKSEWRERSARSLGVPILDQKQTNGCVGWSGTHILMTALRRAGHPVVNLAPGYLYAWINGGRDAGANISDAMTAMMAHGICPADKAPGGGIFRRSYSAAHDAAAQLCRATEAYSINTWEEAMSAGTLGWDFAWSICAGGATTTMDRDGVCGFVRGMANHGVHGDGIKYIASRGDWFIDWPNTWGPTFGIQGRALAGEMHFDCPWREMYAVRAGVLDSTYDPNLPPAVA